MAEQDRNADYAEVHITSIGRTPHLPQMLRTIRADERTTQIHVWTNKLGGIDRVDKLIASTDVFVFTHVRLENGIYDQWNAALDHTARLPNDHRIAVVLNDDLTLPEGAITNVVTKMQSDPGFALVGLPYEGSQQKLDIANVRGTYKDAGLGGFAWAAWPTRCARIPSAYTWWYGDDDLVWRTLDAGEGVGLARGEPVIHEASYTANRWPAEGTDSEADRRLFHSHWG